MSLYILFGEKRSAEDVFFTNPQMFVNDVDCLGRMVLKRSDQINMISKRLYVIGFNPDIVHIIHVKV